MSTIVGAASQGARHLSTLAATTLRRSAAVPMTIRLIATLAALASAIIAVPPVLLDRPVSFGVVAVLGAVAVGLFPRTRWVTAFLVLVVGEWLVATVGENEVTLVRTGLLGAAVYLTHSAAALAAVLPYDCAVTFGLLRTWAGRMLTVLLVGVGIGLVGMFAVTYLPTAQSAVGPIVGSVVAAGLAGLLAWQWRRR